MSARDPLDSSPDLDGIGSRGPSFVGEERETPSVPASRFKKNSALSELTRLNCAGQGCAERNECRRYRIRLARKDQVGDVRLYDWASFDIERSVYGDCLSFVQWRA